MPDEHADVMVKNVRDESAVRCGSVSNYCDKYEHAISTRRTAQQKHLTL